MNFVKVKTEEEEEYLDVGTSVQLLFSFNIVPEAVKPSNKTLYSEMN